MLLADDQGPTIPKANVVISFTESSTRLSLSLLKRRRVRSGFVIGFLEPFEAGPVTTVFTVESTIKHTHPTVQTDGTRTRGLSRYLCVP